MVPSFTLAINSDKSKSKINLEYDNGANDVGDEPKYN
jgi:hypothetical protein